MTHRTYIVDATRDSPDKDPIMLPNSGDLGFSPVQWSLDGNSIVGTASAGGLATYDVLGRRYRKLSMVGTEPRWLPDSHRLLAWSGRDAVIVEPAGEIRRISVPFNVADAVGGLALQADGRIGYLSVESFESDVWMKTIPK